MGNSDTTPLYTRMTSDDVRTANQVVQNALEGTVSGTVLSWENPVSGHSGSVTPLKTFRSKSGAYCREYNETLTIGHRTETYTDTACRAADGQWHPVVVK
jgi:surface antigen